MKEELLECLTIVKKVTQQPNCLSFLVKKLNDIAMIKLYVKYHHTNAVCFLKQNVQNHLISPKVSGAVTYH